MSLYSLLVDLNNILKDEVLPLSSMERRPAASAKIYLMDFALGAGKTNPSGAYLMLPMLRTKLPNHATINEYIAGERIFFGVSESKKIKEIEARIKVLLIKLADILYSSTACSSLNGRHKPNS